MHIPFKSTLVFDAFYMEPFPFQVDNTTYVLDTERQYVLVQKDLSHYATVPSQGLEGCHTDFHNHYFCSSSRFAFFPISDDICEVLLTKNDSDHSLALKVCPFSEFIPNKPCHSSLFGFHYLYLPHEMYVSIICPDSSQGEKMSGHLAARVECSIRTTAIRTFAEQVHDGFLGRNPPIVYQLSLLTNLSTNLPRVTKRLPRLDLPSLSLLDANVTDPDLPFYLEPSVHYPSFLVPVVLIFIVLIAIAIGLRRALSLYVMLRTRVSRSDRRGSNQEVADASV